MRFHVGSGKLPKMKPHLKLVKDQVCDRVIVCGDPARAEKIADLLENPKVLAKNREYHSYSGTFDGKAIMVLSHGVGSAGAAIAFQEIIDLGAKFIIRVGTSGALQKDFPIGGVVVSRGAVRNDGVSALMVPIAFPAVPDFDLTLSLEKTARETVLEMKATTEIISGITLTSDLFYPGVIESDLQVYSKAGAVAVEMEASTLFVIGSLRGIKTAALFAVDGNPLFWDEGKYAPHSSAVQDALKISFFAALKTLSK